MACVQKFPSVFSLDAYKQRIPLHFWIPDVAQLTGTETASGPAKPVSVLDVSVSFVITHFM